MEIKFGNDEFSIGLTDVGGPPGHVFGILFYMIQGQRHLVEAYGEPLGAYSWAIGETIEVLSREVVLSSDLTKADAAIITHLLYDCKYGHFAQTSAQAVLNRFCTDLLFKDSTYLLDRSLGVSFLPDAGGGDCVALLNFGDRVELVGLSDTLGLLQVTLHKTEVIKNLQDLADWILDELKGSSS